MGKGRWISRQTANKIFFLALCTVAACQHPRALRLRENGPADRPLIASYYLLPQENEIRRQSYFRIGRAENVATLELRSAQPLVLTLEREGRLQSASWPASLTLRLTPRQVRAANLVYHLIVASAAWDDRAGLASQAEKLHRRGQPAELLAGGVLLYGDRGEVATDQRRLFLSAGQETEENQAQTRCRRWSSEWKTPCQVLPFLNKLPEGRIELAAAGEAGESQGESEGALEILPAAGQTVRWRSGEGGGETATSHPFTVVSGRQGGLTLVERFSEEEYLAAALSAAAVRQPEARRAVAVAARSLVYSSLGRRHRNEPFDFCASDHCQALGAPLDPAVMAAVRETAGLTLTWRGKLLEGLHSESCGGQTAAIAAAASGETGPFLSVFDGPVLPALPLDLSQEAVLEKWLARPAHTYDIPAGGAWQEPHRWIRSFSIDQLTNRLGMRGTPRRVTVTSRLVSGRVEALEIDAAKGRLALGSAEEILAFLPELPSTLFLARTIDDRAGRPLFFVFFGAGHGHGIGLCQRGAEGLAGRGFTFREILRHYYRGAEIAAAGKK